jgi:ABC-type nitrate/sulfonate/bicarbonate transport system permease component
MSSYYLYGSRSSSFTSPLSVAHTFVENLLLIANNSFLSLFRLLSGTFIGASLGLIAGYCLGRNQLLEILLAPTLRVISSIPIVIFIPILLIIFKLDGDIFRISLISIFIFLAVYQSSFNTIKSFRTEWFDIVSMCEKNEIDLFFQFFLPGALPEILLSLRSILMYGWIVVLIAEMAGGADMDFPGLAYSIEKSRSINPNPDLVMSFVFSLSVISILIDFTVGLFHRRASRWQSIVMLP